MTPPSKETIDGREALLYQMYAALARLVDVVEASDKARSTWAYEHAVSMLSEAEEWKLDQEHAFGKEWRQRRKTRRYPVPK